jgi:hypothetical protein
LECRKASFGVEGIGIPIYDVRHTTPTHSRLCEPVNATANAARLAVICALGSVRQTKNPKNAIATIPTDAGHTLPLVG